MSILLILSSGCLGLAFFNATAGSRAVLRHMLAHAQRNMHLMFDDQQALNHQLVMVSVRVVTNFRNAGGQNLCAVVCVACIGLLQSLNHQLVMVSGAVLQSSWK